MPYPAKGHFQTPKIKDVVRWIARSGGFLARKQDGNPGTIVIWKGWKRLNDLTHIFDKHTVLDSLASGSGRYSVKVFSVSTR